jgi:hypothetical protein
MNVSLFETWFSKQLFPFLRENSVIVMDNDKYHSQHSQQLNKRPTQATRKADIIEYMKSKNLNILENSTKNAIA